MNARENVKKKPYKIREQPNLKLYSAIAAIVIVILVLLIYYFANFGNISVFHIYNSAYKITSVQCTNFTSKALNSNITFSCTAILNVTSISNSLVPSYIIVNKYTFTSNSTAYSFMQALHSDLNTSPWYSNIPSAYYNDTLVYTTVVYPNYKNTNGAAEVLALYRQINNTVISASTSNITNNASNSFMKEYTEYLLFHYENQIENISTNK